MFRIIQGLLEQKRLYYSRLFNETTFYKKFHQDLRLAKQSIVIDSPYLTERQIKNFLPAFRKLIDHDINIRVNTRNPECHSASMRDQAHLAARKLIDIGVRVVIYDDWRHWKCAVIDNKILWEGSMNILSHNRSREIMRRSYSAYLCHQMSCFSNLSH